ncbi:MAG: zf-HC2 domain-containing protein [Thiotrichales bacterium]|nr:zf-HC2 domain-containing protein [Thiotrichales bacterium]
MKWKKCSEITRLVSESEERKLSFVERMAVRLHLFICGPCEHYKNHLSLLKKICEQVKGNNPLLEKAALPEESRKRILKNISSS